MSQVCSHHGVEYILYSGKMRCPECSRENCRKYNAKNSERRKRWHQSEAGKAARRKYENSDKGKACRRRENYKILARKAARRAIKKGTLIVPDECSRCSLPSKVQAHHYLGYGKEHQLDIVWLCWSCHCLAHGKNPIA